MFEENKKNKGMLKIHNFIGGLRSHSFQLENIENVPFYTEKTY